MEFWRMKRLTHESMDYKVLFKAEAYVIGILFKGV